MREIKGLLVSFLVLGLSLGGINTDFLVVLLEGGKIFSGLRELTFFHTFSDVPVDEGSLGVHEIELVVNAGESLDNGGGVGDHADGAVDLGQVSSWDGVGLAGVDSSLESGGAPVDELDGALGLDGGDGGIDVLGDDVSAVHQAAGHVLSVARVALGHHVVGLEDGVGDLGDGEHLVEGLLARNDGGVGGEHEVDAGVGHQGGLEVVQVDVEGAFEAETGGEGGGDLGDQSVEVLVGGALNVQVAAADIVQGLVVQAEGAVGVLQEGVGGEDRVVGLDDGSGDLGRGGDGERQLGLAAVVDGEALQEEGSQTRTGSSASGVEDQEALQSSAVVRQLADAVQDGVDQLLANGVVATGVVVGGILLATDDGFGVVQRSVLSSTHFVAHSGLQIHVDRPGNVLARGSLAEEGVERVVRHTHRCVTGHHAIGVNAVLQAVQFPARVTGLDTSLSQVNRDDFAHCFKKRKRKRKERERRGCADVQRRSSYNKQESPS